MVNITIDGSKIEVPEGTTVLQAARTAGIHIPTLCDHPKLVPYGGCRLCLVEVEGARTPQPSCTLPVNSNMVVRTDTQKIRDARKFVLTLIFSERNHFCMYCQKSGGDCELQNCAYAEDMTHWPIQPNWLQYPVDASHKHYVMDHNRCILCRRCVRACAELAGNFTLGIEERGANSFLVADLGIPLGESSCISCGTCVQVCPTGALIDRKSAYVGHDAEAQLSKSICLGCSVGCGIETVVRDNQLMRVDGDWNAAVNGGILCETGRFLSLNDERERLVTPLVRKNGALKAATWDEALDVVSSKLASLKGKNGDGIAALASTRLPAEALHLFKQLFAEGLHSQMVTTSEEGAYTAVSSAVARELGMPFEGSLSSLEASDCILSAGVDLAADHQVVGFFVKRSLPRGTRLILVDGQTSALASLADAVLKPAKGMDTDLLLSMAAAVVELGLAKAAPTVANLAEYSPDAIGPKAGIPAEEIRAAARILASAEKPSLVYGKGLSGKSAAQTLKALIELGRLVGALDENHSAIISAKGQANSFAAAQYGLDKPFELNGHQAVFLALGDEQPSQRLIQKLENAPFLAVQASYISPVTARADVVLPVAAWSEIEGHYLNMEGKLQAAHAALPTPDGTWSNEKVMEGIAERVGVTPRGDWKEQLAQTTAPAPIQLN